MKLTGKRGLLLAALFLCAQGPSVAALAAPETPLPGSIAPHFGAAARPWQPAKADLAFLKAQSLAIATPSFPAVARPVAKATGCAAAQPSDEPPTPARKFFNDGLSALGREKLDEAAFNFSEAAKADPGNPLADDSLFWLGEVRRIQGKSGEAAVAFEKVKGAYAEEARYRAALLYDHLGRPGDAGEEWRKIAGAQGSPFRARAYFQLGLEALTEGRMERAVSNFERSLELSKEADETFGYASYHLAVLCRDDGQLPRARKLLDSLLLARPDHPASDAARVLSGWLELELGNPEAARRRLDAYFAQGMRSGWLDARALYALARVTAEAGNGGEASAALQKLDPARERDLLARGWLDVGKAALDRQEFAQAALGFAEAGKHSTGEEKCAAVFLGAAALAGQGKTGEAASAFLAVDPKCQSYAEARRRAAIELAEEGDLKGASEILSALASAGQADELAQRDLGDALLALGDQEGAKAAYLKVSENSEGYADALYGRARLLFAEGKHEESASLLARFKAFFPSHPARSAAALLEARANFEKGGHQEALGLLDQLLRYSSDEKAKEEARYLKGTWLFSLGREAEGASELEKLVADHPAGTRRAEALHRLGKAVLANGRADEALKYAEKGLFQKPAAAVRTQLLGVKGEALYALGRNEPLLDLYKAEPGNLALNRLAALAQGRLGRLEPMALEVSKYLKTAPDDPEGARLLVALGDGLRSAGRHAEAAERYGQAAARLKGEEALNALLLRAESTLSGGKSEEARKFFAEVAAVPSPLGLKALRRLAEMAEKTGDRKELAQAYLDLYRAETDGGAKALAARKAAALLVEAGRGAEAEALLAGAAPQATGFDREQQALYADLGELILKRGAHAEAVTVLRRALSVGRQPDEPRAGYLLAGALHTLGQKEAALETCLRLGYHYTLENGYAARALLFAASLLLSGGKAGEAEPLLQRVSREAAPPMKEEAAKLLADLKGPGTPKGTE